MGSIPKVHRCTKRWRFDLNGQSGAGEVAGGECVAATAYQNSWRLID